VAAESAQGERELEAQPAALVEKATHRRHDLRR